MYRNVYRLSLLLLLWQPKQAACSQFSVVCWTELSLVSRSSLSKGDIVVDLVDVVFYMIVTESFRNISVSDFTLTVSAWFLSKRQYRPVYTVDTCSVRREKQM